MDTKLDSYRTNETMGKSQVDLILQVYDGAIKAYTLAKSHYEIQDNNAGVEQLDKARKFVTHLFTTLDLDRGGEVAASLAKLYTTVLTQTDIVQATKDIPAIDSLLQVLENLREGWVGIRDQQKNQPTAATKVEHVNTAF